MAGALPVELGRWRELCRGDVCDTQAHRCVWKTLQRFLIWKGCCKISQTSLDSEGWIQHCLSSGEKSLLELLTLKEQGRGSASDRRV